MYDKLLDIIAFVMTEITVNNKSIKAINYQNLEAAGFSKSEISAALSWLNDFQTCKPDYNFVHVKKDDLYVRILDRTEREIFTPDAWTELNNYLSLGVINYEQFEFLIERFTEMNVRNMDKSNIKSVVAAVVYTQSMTSKNGGNVILHGGEAIN